MTIVMSFTPDTEKRLKAKADRRGLSIEKYLDDLVQQDVHTEFSFDNAPLPTAEERAKAWLDWCASHKPLPFEADDSRESIYEGRGE